MIKYSIRLLILTVVIILQACSLDPKIADESEIDIKTTKELRSFVDGAYTIMKDYRYYGKNMIFAGEIRADNIYSTGGTNRMREWAQMKVLPTEKEVDNLLTYAYGAIANANSIINTNIEEVDGEDADINHLYGEAYLIRAFAHFDMLRAFGQTYVDGADLGVSYVKEFKGEERNIPRGTVSANQSDLYSDVESGIAFLKKGGQSTYASNKINLTLDAGIALKSRIATYFRDYDKLLENNDEIVDIINNYPITPASGLANYWKQTVPGEASIFELAMSSQDNNGTENLAYMFWREGFGDAVLFKNLKADAGFDPNDVRGNPPMIEVDPGDGHLRNHGKYTDLVGGDNIKVFRIEELILNYSEALYFSDKGNKERALQMLNSIPAHRNAPLYKEINSDNILEERRKELLFEGFRLHDLARFHKDVRPMDSGAPYNHGLVPAGDSRLALPISQHELDSNNNSQQNLGY